jgi:hypothetical protein
MTTPQMNARMHKNKITKSQKSSKSGKNRTRPILSYFCQKGHRQQNGDNKANVLSFENFIISFHNTNLDFLILK